MTAKQIHLKRLIILSMMTALDVLLTPLFPIAGMYPMSSVLNIIGGATMGAGYTSAMAVMTAIIRMAQGRPPLALTGAFFGALLAGYFFQKTRHIAMSALGEFLGTGLIGSLLSYPAMVLFTGTKSNLHWFIFTPTFIGATLIGAILALPLLAALQKQAFYKTTQSLFLERH